MQQWVEGSTFNTTGGLANSNTALAILGMKSGSEKTGSMRCLCVLRKASLQRRSKLGGNPTASGAAASLCSIWETASCTAVDHTWPAPSWEDVGGLPFPEVVMPRLPTNPSKRPGKKLLSRGLSAARPTMMSGMTSGCLRGSLRSNSCTQPQWFVILEESSPIRFFVSCRDRSSSRWD